MRRKRENCSRNIYFLPLSMGKYSSVMSIMLYGFRVWYAHTPCVLLTFLLLFGEFYLFIPCAAVFPFFLQLNWMRCMWCWWMLKSMHCMASIHSTQHTHTHWMNVFKIVLHNIHTIFIFFFLAICCCCWLLECWYAHVVLTKIRWKTEHRYHRHNNGEQDKL